MSMPVDRAPLHLQISDMLMREIQSGVLIDGEKLAPERRMASDLGISVGTLRKALQDLQAKGMLQRVHGSGNYVHHNVDASNVYALFRLELVSGRAKPTATLLSVDKMNKPDDLPEFGIADDAFRFRRLRLLNDTLVALEEIWLDGSYANDITLENAQDSMYLFYKEQLGFWITRTEDRVSVQASPDWAPEQWLETDTPVAGFVERWSKDQRGNVAEYSRTWFNPKKAQFVSRN